MDGSDIALERFRAHVSAATLKPANTSWATTVQIEFPRSRERGHIEAITNRLYVRGWSATFPRSRERGHIEAPAPGPR